MKVINKDFEVTFGTKYVTFVTPCPRDILSRDVFLKSITSENYKDFIKNKNETYRLARIEHLFKDYLQKLVFETYPTLLVDKKYSKVLANKYRIFCREIGNYIYDQVGYIHTPYVTLQALKKMKLKKFNKNKHWVKEHVHAKQEAAKKILEELYNETLTFERLVELIDIFRQVAHTTAEENTKLKKYQKDGDIYDWKANYDAIGAVLYKLVDGYEGPLTHVENMKGNTYLIADLITD